MGERRSYAANIIVNGRNINEVVIDPYFETKHSDINDALILELVKYLDGKEFLPEEYDGAWEYFVLDRLEHQRKLYRLVWCMRDHHMFIGIINCFRR